MLPQVLFLACLCHFSPCAEFQLIQRSLLFPKGHSFSFICAFGKAQKVTMGYPVASSLLQAILSPSCCPFGLPDSFLSHKSLSSCSHFCTTLAPIPRKALNCFYVCLPSSLSPVDIVYIFISITMWAPGGHGILYTQCLT